MFWLVLLLINFVCFLPYYLLNVRAQPNPFAFLFEKRLRHRQLKNLIFSKLGFSDPFRINFEFTAVLLLLLLFDAPLGVTVFASALVLLFTQIYIIYLSVMLFVFSRTPAFFSDISLIKTGFLLFRRHTITISIGLLILIVGLAYLAYIASTWLVEAYQHNSLLSVAVLIFVVVIGVLDFKKQKELTLFNWKRHKYKDLHWRNVFSTTLHIARNLIFCKQYQHIFRQNKTAFAQKNYFSDVKLSTQPNIIFICIESYGAKVYKDLSLTNKIDDLLNEYRRKLVNAKYHLCSNFSTAPIYSGGSWLSYSSFMYGIKIENIQLYETLFESVNNFGAYESIFHFLHRNDYQNVLSCPMGGVDNKDVDWGSINRCFQSDYVIDWETLDFVGKKLPFFGLKKRFCAPDQYVINHAYDYAKQNCERPFSLFYCTMNSHIPWISPTEIAPDWRSVNSPDYKAKVTTDEHKSNTDKYMASIRYQLASVFDFALQNESDDLVIVVFGDHQPPLIAIPRMGLETPVHIISKSKVFRDTFMQHGFINRLRLNGHKESINHEGFMSIFASACNRAFGEDKTLSLPILPQGANLMPDEQGEQK
jgi:hypothetical protein